MALQKARQMEAIRARFGSLVDQGPSPGLEKSNRSYIQTLLSQPRWKPLARAVPPKDLSTLVSTRIADIKRRSTPSHPVCLKCGERGHKAMQCRNALVCFSCNKTGHISTSCPSLQSFHTPLESPPPAPTMAPNSNRRGVARGRYQPFGHCPPLRQNVPPPNIQGHFPVTDHVPPPQPQVMPDRHFHPFAPPPIPPHPRPPPHQMIQTPLIDQSPLDHQLLLSQ